MYLRHFAFTRFATSTAAFAFVTASSRASDLSEAKVTFWKSASATKTPMVNPRRVMAWAIRSCNTFWPQSNSWLPRTIADNPAAL